MTVPPEELARIAALAGLTVPPAELEQLGKDVSAILEFVSTIKSADEISRAAFRPGPATAPLRDDDESGTDVSPDIGMFAPESRDGFFLVPRPPGVEGS